MTLDDRATAVRARFRAAFAGAEATHVATAPGRVNLIGEHTDYNEGFVLPMAIDHRIDMAARRRPDGLVRLFAVDLGEEATFRLTPEAPIDFDQERRWSNYLRGVIDVLRREMDMPLGGVDIAFQGDVPLGAGLSSSAALEVAAAVVLRALFELPLSDVQLARLCQRAENDFVGNRCGIMDQFISLLGRRDHALLTDCRSLDAVQVPLSLRGHRIVVCDSGVRHSLVDSEYNQRRAQCEQGVAALAALDDRVTALRDVSPALLDAARGALDGVLFRRCRHVVRENARVLASREALELGELAVFGRAMNLSHDSLRDDYEVSCPEVDRLVELARAVPGVLGARITGGGFGGCTVNLVTEGAAERFPDEVLAPYAAQTGIVPRLFLSTAADGARLV